MNIQAFIDTDSTMVADEKRMLAMEESTPTCNQRFSAMATPQSEYFQRTSRELLVNSSGIGDFEPPSHNLISPIASLPALTTAQHSKKDVS